MKTKLIIIVLFAAVLFCHGWAEEDNSATDANVFTFDPFLIDHLPGAYFYTSFIENYAPDTTFLIEENNGFSIIDNPRVYFEGDSFVNFNWFYNGIDINSVLNDGSPAVILPFSSVGGWALRGENPGAKDYGMNFIAAIPGESFSRITASTVYSDLGTYFATFWIQPDHPASRADRLYTERRKIDSNYFLDYMLSKKFKNSNSHLLFSLNYFDMRRQFNDFNAFNNTFNEEGKLFTANTRWRKNVKKGYYDLFAVVNLLDRSNQQAEIGNYPGETTGKKRFSLLTGIDWKMKKLNLALSFLLEKETLNPFERNFPKDLIDNDGDGLFPFGSTGELKTGKFTGAAFNLNLRYPFTYRLFSREVSVDTFADLRFSSIAGSEDIHDYNAVFFDRTPYQVVLWNRGGDYRSSNANAKIGMNIAADISGSVSLLAKLFLNYDNLNFDEGRNNLSFVSPGFDVGILLFKNKKTNLLFSYGVLPYDIRENTNFFLETGRPYGTIHRWTDGSGDSVFQPGEEGAVFGYTGGRYHYVDENISAPLKERLLLTFSTRLSRHFRLNIKAIYKKIKNNFRVKFNREYGFYEHHEGHNLYFFDGVTPFGDYYLASGGYEKDPFYAQFHFNIKGRRAEKWFFSFSFMAHMGMGDTAFGNGPGSNDIGILDESQANPNAWINGFGRVDGDRGFVAKSYFGFYVFKKLFMGVSLKYRDGNPFAFFNTLSAHDQRVIYYQTIKAEDEKGVKGGPREDYVADISIKLNYNFKLFNREAVLTLSLFNILDFGAELSEYVFSGGLRDAVELQIPRSIRLTLGWRF